MKDISFRNLDKKKYNCNTKTDYIKYQRYNALYSKSWLQS